MRPKALLYVGIAVLCVAVFARFLVQCNEESSIPLWFIKKESIMKDYTRNAERYSRVAEFLESDRDDIWIDRTEEDGYVAKKYHGGVVSFQITDPVIDNDVRHIMTKMGYEHIAERENAMYFMRQGSLSFCHGLAYSKDGEEPDDGTITDLVHIEGNWYYYRGY